MRGSLVTVSQVCSVCSPQLLHLRLGPAHRRADPALGVGLRRQGVARAEADQFLDRRLHPRRIDLPGDIRRPWLPGGGSGGTAMAAEPDGGRSEQLAHGTTHRIRLRPTSGKRRSIAHRALGRSGMRSATAAKPLAAQGNRPGFLHHACRALFLAVARSPPRPRDRAGPRSMSCSPPTAPSRPARRSSTTRSPASPPCSTTKWSCRCRQGACDRPAMRVTERCSAKAPSFKEGKVSWAPVRGGISADGTQGFTYGFLIADCAATRRGASANISLLGQAPGRLARRRLPPAGRARRARCRRVMIAPSLPAFAAEPIADPAIIAGHSRSVAAAEKSFSDRAQIVGLQGRLPRIWPRRTR